LVRPGFGRSCLYVNILAKPKTGRNGPRRHIAAATEFFKLL